MDINKYYYLNASKVWRVLCKTEEDDLEPYESCCSVNGWKVEGATRMIFLPLQRTLQPVSTSCVHSRRLEIPNSTSELQLNGPWVRACAIGVVILAASRLQRLILIHNIVTAHLLFLSVPEQVSAGHR